MPKMGDEIHHTGWNACAGCFGKLGMCRRYLVCPTLMTSRVYIIDTQDPKNLKLHKVNFFFNCLISLIVSFLDC